MGTKQMNGPRARPLPRGGHNLGMTMHRNNRGRDEAVPGPRNHFCEEIFPAILFYYAISSRASKLMYKCILGMDSTLQRIQQVVRATG
jgi:hypothetical protein